MNRLLAILSAVMMAGLAGCTCQQTLELSACRPDATACLPGEDEHVVPWTPELGAQYPGLAAMLAGLKEGGHAHAAWDGEPNALWQELGVSGDPPKAHIDYDGTLVRLRLVSC